MWLQGSSMSTGVEDWHWDRGDRGEDACRSCNRDAAEEEEEEEEEEDTAVAPSPSLMSGTKIRTGVFL